MGCGLSYIVYLLLKNIFSLGYHDEFVFSFKFDPYVVVDFFIAQLK